MSLDAQATVKFELDIADYRALQVHLCRPVRQRPPLMLPLVCLASAVVVGVAIAFLPSPNSFFLGFFAGLVWMVVVIRYNAKRAQRLTDPSPNGSILCPYEYSIVEGGVRSVTPHWDGVTRWSGILSADETDQHFFLTMDRGAAYTIPKRAFASASEAASFIERIRANLGSAT